MTEKPEQDRAPIPKGRSWPRPAGLLALVVGALGFILPTFPRLFGPPVIRSEVRETRPQPALEVLSINRSRLEAHTRELSRHDSRMVGHPGCEIARDYVIDRFREIGLENIRTQDFQVPVPMDREARLTIPNDNLEFPLLGFWPNGVRTPTTPPAGLIRTLLYAPGGTFEELDLSELGNHAVLMDLNTGVNWLNAASLGCDVILFIEPETAFRHECDSKFLNTPVTCRRFWVPREAGLELARKARQSQDLQVRIEALMEWENATGTNIVGVVPGTDPKKRNEAIYLSAYYDAISSVPSAAPGAEQSASISALLELARFFQENPPARTMVFLATSGHFQAMAGIRAFVEQSVPNRLRSPSWPDLNLNHEKIAFVSLDLTTSTNRLGLTLGDLGDYHGHRGSHRPGILSRSIRAVTAVLADASPELGLDTTFHFYDGINRTGDRSEDSLIPEKIPTESELFFLRGDTGLSFVTLDDERPFFDSPHDRIERMSFENLADQTRMAGVFLKALADMRDFLPNLDPRPGDAYATIFGDVVEMRGTAALAAAIPVPGALVLGRRHPSKSWRGVRLNPMTFSDESGKYVLHGFNRHPWSEFLSSVRVESYFLDPRTGDIRYAPDLGTEGHGKYPISVFPTLSRKEMRSLVAPCVAVDLYDLFNPRDLQPIQRIGLLEAQTHVPPQTFGLVNIPDQVPDALSFFLEPEPCATLFLAEHSRFKIMATTLLGTPSLLLLGPEGWEDRRIFGSGYVASRGRPISGLPFQTASHMWRVSQDRIEGFRKYGIESRYLDTLQNAARAALEEASSARALEDLRTYRVRSREAWGTAAKAYPVVKATADDMVLAVMFYMALMIPFTFFVERMVFACSDVRKRIGACIGIFLGIFLIFRFVHPAFDITLTPALVLLSFMILVLSLLVMVIIVSKFETQFRKMREEGGELHVADVGRLGAGIAAFSLGVSNLRNRPVRTLLTSGALVLLTFTLLSFTSVTTLTGFQQRARRGEASYTGMLVTSPVFDPLHTETWRYLKQAYPDALTVPRVWHAPVRHRSFGRGGNAFGVSLENPGHRVHPISVLLQLSPDEKDFTGVHRSLVSGRWFREDETDVCIIPSTLARFWEIQDRDLETEPIHALFRSTPYRIVGIFNAEPPPESSDEVIRYHVPRLDEITDLDGESICPIDFEMSESVLAAMRGRLASTGDQGFLPSEIVTRIESSKVILVSWNRSTAPNLPLNLGREDTDRRLASVAVAFPDGETALAGIRRFVDATALGVYAGLDGKCFDYSSHQAVSLSALGGFAGISIPLLISILIVLNTMLGSVYERRREIAIFSSLGLAPTHIGFLFLGEACVYGNLAAVVGYLLGQASARVMTQFNLLPGMTLNYSAGSAVVTSTLVILVVIISTLYPAYVGARLAAPSVERRWRLPEPKDDRYRIPLPFTISTGEARALFRYLHEYFAAHLDYMMEGFHAAHLALRDREREQGIGARVWPAPYDLGVCQQIEISGTCTDREGFWELGMTIRRLEGDMRSWKKTNRLFLSELRKQFLIWRSLSPAQKARYAGKTADEHQETLSESSGTREIKE